MAPLDSFEMEEDLGVHKRMSLLILGNFLNFPVNLLLFMR